MLLCWCRRGIWSLEARGDDVRLKEITLVPFKKHEID